MAEEIKGKERKKEKIRTCQTVSWQKSYALVWVSKVLFLKPLSLCMADRPHAQKKLLFPCQAEVSRSLVRFQCVELLSSFPPCTCPPPPPGFPPQSHKGLVDNKKPWKPNPPPVPSILKGRKRRSWYKTPIKSQRRPFFSFIVAADPPIHPGVYPAPCFFRFFLARFFFFFSFFSVSEPSFAYGYTRLYVPIHTQILQRKHYRISTTQKNIFF